MATKKKTTKKAAVKKAAAEYIYITKLGDTYKKIAEVYGVTLAKLLQDNSIYNQYAITAGKRIVIKKE